MTITGIVHGKTIELKADPHLPDGEEVELTIQVKKQVSAQAWGDGLKRSAGALADDPNAEKDMEEILRARRLESRKQVID
jgi:hypothetical protein